MAGPPEASAAEHALPHWTFPTGSRSHWYVEGGTDAGLPSEGQWRIPCESGQPHLVGPQRCWRAEDSVAVTIDATWTGPMGLAHLRWRTLGEQGFNDERSVAFTISSDGTPVTIPLSTVTAYQGLITGLRIDPPAGRAPDALLTLRSVTVQRAR